jgi:ABC-type nickel/cobalt efflux system permease component RcnA
MAEEPKHSAHDTGNNAVTLGIAAITGVGFALMAVALSLGVIRGESADTNIIRMIFTGGATLFVVGFIAWLSVVRPWENFDDINQPKYHGHHHDEHVDEKDAAH